MSLISRIFNRSNNKGSSVKISGEARGKIIDVDDVEITSMGIVKAILKRNV